MRVGRNIRTALPLKAAAMKPMDPRNESAGDG